MNAQNAPPGAHGLIGGSPPMVELLRNIENAARNDSTVLIQGESGTGKELVTRAIVAAGPRAGKPFVAVNCAGLPDTLIESELFGHEKGSFTSAHAQRRGKFELAHGGTLFLDEIGELSLRAQAKLLRALQEGEIDRLGGAQPLRVDVRLIAATNRDLERIAAAGEFRHDLYYRLNVFTIRTPPLRERREDIPALAAHFVSKYGAKLGRNVRGVSPGAIRRLQRYEWPGNVRQLENTIHRAILESQGDVLSVDDFRFSDIGPARAANRRGRLREALDDTARQVCRAAFYEAEGDFRKAASILGLHWRSIHRLFRRLGLQDLLR